MSDEAHVSAQSNQKKTQARLSKPDEHQGGSRNLEAPPSKGAHAPHSLGGLEAGLTMIHSARFQRADRVISARDYARVRRLGRRSASTYFAVSIATRAAANEAIPDQGLPPVARGEGVDGELRSRLGLIVSRKVGNAVARNRVKRAVREWFRNGSAQLAESVDIVVIARRGAADRRVSEICRELSTLVAEGPAATKPGAGE